MDNNLTIFCIVQLLISLVSRMTVDDAMLTVDMLPAPRRLAPKQPAVEAAPAPALAAASRGVGLGDQIAIRSYVLGKTL